MIVVPGTDISIPAIPLAGVGSAAACTEHLDAWARDATGRRCYLTVQLTSDLWGMRVSMSSIGLHRGTWFLISSAALSRSGYIAAAALLPRRDLGARPMFFTAQAQATLVAGSILNVGRVAPLAGSPGGGAQAEFLFGPPPRLQVLAGTWVDRFGHA